jgi:hypothetical protein
MIIIPWVLSLVTAIWFALVARKAERSWVPWAVSGAVFALVTGTIVLGLGQATANPFSSRERTIFHIRWAVEAVILMGALGWLLTMPLHRHHLALWRKAMKSSPPAPASPAPTAPKPKAEAPKQALSQTKQP